MESDGRRLHALAAKAREKGEFIESLQYSDQALLAYDNDGDARGFAEGISCRCITLRVYANLHGSTRLLLLAKQEMIGSVEISRENSDRSSLSLPLFNLAQIHEDLLAFDEAIATYKEAISMMELYPSERHHRPSVLANMKVHMTICDYKAGNKNALEDALTAISELEKAEEPDAYSKHVWVSGGYMRLADALRTVPIFTPVASPENSQRNLCNFYFLCN